MYVFPGILMLNLFTCLIFISVFLLLFLFRPPLSSSFFFFLGFLKKIVSTLFSVPSSEYFISAIAFLKKNYSDTC